MNIQMALGKKMFSHSCSKPFPDFTEEIGYCVIVFVIHTLFALFIFQSVRLTQCHILRSYSLGTVQSKNHVLNADGMPAFQSYYVPDLPIKS